MELLLVALVLAAALVALPRGWPRAAALMVSLGALAALASVRPGPPVDHRAARPADATAPSGAAFTSSRACRACHPAAYESWAATHHRKMTQPATADAVLAPFDGRTLQDGARSYRVFESDGGYMVDMPRYGTNGLSPDERMIRPVVMTTGSHHLQAYWIPAPAAEEAAEPRGRAVFNRVCATCHGPDGRARGEVPELTGRERVPGVVTATLDDSRHTGLVTDEERAAVERFVNRIQSTGRLMQFPFVWFVRHGRWVHEEFTFLQPPHSPDLFEPYGDTWSDACDQCHSVRPGYDWTAATQSGAAEVAELGIACEACHGPGRSHVLLHRNPATRYGQRLGLTLEDDIVQPASLDHRAASGLCGQCHGELVLKDADARFQPGTALEDHADVVRYTPKDPPKWLKSVLEDEPTLLQDAFWTDGTIRIAGRNYNAMLETGCFTRGTMSCLDCHSMHDAPPSDQLKPAAMGDRVCTDCHPTIAADIEAHTHHLVGSAGSACVNCHMPHTTVGLLTLMRSHRVDSPSAATSAWTGRPNACALCHLDTPLAEIAEQLTAWYGHGPLPEVADDGEASAAVAWAVRGDAAQRATIAWHLSWPPALAASGADWSALYLARLLEDPYPAVRAIAGESLRRLPGFEEFEYDYVGDAQTRRAAMARALERWRALHPSPEARPGALIEATGPDQAAIDALAARRDDTEVHIAE